MLNNLVNADDVLRLAGKLRRGQIGDILGLVFERKRVESCWARVEGEPTHWFNVPAVRERANRLVSGDVDKDHFAYLTDRYLAERSSLRALSLGCGRGWRETRWAQTGKFVQIDAFDLSEGRIEHARQRALEDGLADVLRYEVANAYTVHVPEKTYDVVIFEDSLHHFSPLDVLLARVNSWLSPTGYLFVNEFVGPARFQWSDRQLELANSLLRLLPEDYRRQWHTSAVKRKVDRPSRLRMVLKDPSEAVQSDRIVPLLRARFEVIEERKLGGTVVNPMLQEIAHHFLAPDDFARAFLEACFRIEEAFMDAGEIPSDHMLVVCRRQTP